MFLSTRFALSIGAFSVLVGNYRVLYQFLHVEHFMLSIPTAVHHSPISPFFHAWPNFVHRRLPSPLSNAAHCQGMAHCCVWPASMHHRLHGPLSYTARCHGMATAVRGPLLCITACTAHCQALGPARRQQKCRF